MYKKEQIYKYLEYHKEMSDAYCRAKRGLIIQYNLASLFSSEKAKEVLKKIAELDKKMVTIQPTGIFVLDWLVDAYSKAIVINTIIDTDNIEYDKEKNEKIIELFNRIITDKDMNLHNIEDNFNVVENNNKIEYRVKNIPIFWDSVKPIKYSNSAYHGTTVWAAQNILQMGKLLPKNRIGIGATADTFFNQDRIFFTQDFKESVDYAKRWKKEKEYVILEVDLFNYDVYKRKHLIANRKNNLLFVKATELPANIIKNIYLIDYLGRKKQINKAELLAIKDSRPILQYYKKYSEIKSRINNILDNFHEELNKTNNTFYTIEQHLNYLNTNNSVKVEKRDGKHYIWKDDVLRYIIYPIKNINGTLYHSTGLTALKNILKTKTIRWDRLIVKHALDYHKIFFSQTPEYCQMFGKSIANTYAILECNLQNCNVYNYTLDGLELFVWHDLDISVIEKIYIYKGNKIVKTYTKQDIEKERVFLHE